MNDLSGALTILSAMITPAVLIMATGSLSLTTSQRLSRSIDRVRKVSDYIGKLNEEETSPDRQEMIREFLLQQLLTATRRSRLMQRTMTCLYLALCTFVAVILVIGLFEVMGLRFAWLLLLLGFTGVSLLFYGCLLLMSESRMALQSVNKEMDHALKLNNLTEPKKPRFMLRKKP